jgi:hypothetical protein
MAMPRLVHSADPTADPSERMQEALRVRVAEAEQVLDQPLHPLKLAE